MKKNSYLALIVVAAFCLGFTVRSIVPQHGSSTEEPGRVTGIGGIFFKCQDPAKLREWYKTHLGFIVNPYGAVFEWRQGRDSTQKGFTQWSPFSEKTKYFEPSVKDFMINYRVVNLDGLVAQLKNDGVTITDSVESVEYGKFVHILDGEGNKIELWQPNDVAYDKLGAQMHTQTIK